MLEPALRLCRGEGVFCGAGDLVGLASTLSPNGEAVGGEGVVAAMLVVWLVWLLEPSPLAQPGERAG